LIPRGGFCPSSASASRPHYILWGDVIRGIYRRKAQADPEDYASSVEDLDEVGAMVDEDGESLISGAESSPLKANRATMKVKAKPTKAPKTTKRKGKSKTISSSTVTPQKKIGKAKAKQLPSIGEGSSESGTNSDEAPLFVDSITKSRANLASSSSSPFTVGKNRATRVRLGSSGEECFDLDIISDRSDSDSDITKDELLQDSVVKVATTGTAVAATKGGLKRKGKVSSPIRALKPSAQKTSAKVATKTRAKPKLTKSGNVMLPSSSDEEGPSVARTIGKVGFTTEDVIARIRAQTLAERRGTEAPLSPEKLTMSYVIDRVRERDEKKQQMQNTDAEMKIHISMSSPTKRKRTAKVIAPIPSQVPVTMSEPAIAPAKQRAPRLEGKPPLSPKKARMDDAAQLVKDRAKAAREALMHPEHVFESSDDEIEYTGMLGAKKDLMGDMTNLVAGLSRSTGINMPKKSSASNSRVPSTATIPPTMILGQKRRVISYEYFDLDDISSDSDISIEEIAPTRRTRVIKPLPPMPRQQTTRVVASVTTQLPNGGVLSTGAIAPRVDRSTALSIIEVSSDGE
jgi:hypothetical protein